MASGMARAYRGESAVAIEHLEHAAQLSPLDPLAYLFWYGIAFAHFADTRYTKASGWIDRALRAAPNYMPGMRLKRRSVACSNKQRKDANGLVV
jgi:tetratricopeptide (TPR) repeat protein